MQSKSVVNVPEKKAPFNKTMKKAAVKYTTNGMDDLPKKPAKKVSPKKK